MLPRQQLSPRVQSDYLSRVPQVVNLFPGLLFLSIISKTFFFYITRTHLFISILWSNNYLPLECSSFRWRLKRVIPTVQIASPDALVNGRSARVERRPNISWGGPKSDSEGCPEFKKEAEVINIKKTLYLSSLFQIACPTRTWHSDSPFYWDVALITPQVAFQSAFQT